MLGATTPSIRADPGIEHRCAAQAQHPLRRALVALPLFAGATLGLVTLLILLNQRGLGLPWWSTLLTALAVWAICSAAVHWLALPHIQRSLAALAAAGGEQPPPPALRKAEDGSEGRAELPALCACSRWHQLLPRLPGHSMSCVRESERPVAGDEDRAPLLPAHRSSTGALVAAERRLGSSKSCSSQLAAAAETSEPRAAKPELAQPAPGAAPGPLQQPDRAPLTSFSTELSLDEAGEGASAEAAFKYLQVPWPRQVHASMHRAGAAR